MFLRTRLRRNSPAGGMGSGKRIKDGEAIFIAVPTSRLPPPTDRRVLSAPARTGEFFMEEKASSSPRYTGYSGLGLTSSDNAMSTTSTTTSSTPATASDASAHQSSNITGASREIPGNGAAPQQQEMHNTTGKSAEVEKHQKAYGKSAEQKTEKTENAITGPEEAGATTESATSSRAGRSKVGDRQKVLGVVKLSCRRGDQDSLLCPPAAEFLIAGEGKSASSSTGRNQTAKSADLLQVGGTCSPICEGRFEGIET